MQRLTVPTGGRAFTTDSIDALQGAFEELLEELSNQYLLGYQPTYHRPRRHLARNQGGDRGQRSGIRARQGYRADSVRSDEGVRLSWLGRCWLSWRAAAARSRAAGSAAVSLVGRRQPDRRDVVEDRGNRFSISSPRSSAFVSTTGETRRHRRMDAAHGRDGPARRRRRPRATRRTTPCRAVA